VRKPPSLITSNAKMAGPEDLLSSFSLVQPEKPASSLGQPENPASSLVQPENSTSSLVHPENPVFSLVQPENLGVAGRLLTRTDQQQAVGASHRARRPGQPGCDDPARRPGMPGCDDPARRPGQLNGDDPAQRPGQPGCDDPARRPGQPGCDDPVRRPGQPGCDDPARRPGQPGCDDPARRLAGRLTLARVVPGLEGSGIPTLLPSQPIHVYMVQITSAGDTCSVVSSFFVTLNTFLV
jgi:hypothetical protein